MAESLPDLEELLTGWLLELRGQKKSAETLKAYRSGVTAFIEFCVAEGIPVALTKPAVVAWLAAMADSEPATARLRLTAVKLFARWLAVEEGIDVDGVLTVRAPKLDQKIVPHLSDAAVKAMINTCAGGDDFRDRRDRALIMLFVDTGVRAAEMVALDVEDISVVDCVVTVVRGKGARGRRARFSQQTAAALHAYLRARRRAGNGDSGPLWIGSRGRLSYTGLAAAMRKRAEAAGVTGFHLHRLRHSSAVRWIAAGGTEVGLMSQGGWKSRAMIDRYTASAREQLASDEFDRLGLGIDL